MCMRTSRTRDADVFDNAFHIIFNQHSSSAFPIDDDTLCHPLTYFDNHNLEWRLPLLFCAASIDVNSALKFPAPNPS